MALTKRLSIKTTETNMKHIQVNLRRNVAKDVGCFQFCPRKKKGEDHPGGVVINVLDSDIV